MSRAAYLHLATDVAKFLLAEFPTLRPHPDKPATIQAVSSQNEVFSLDLTPFAAKPAPATAKPFFSGIETVSALLSAYQAARCSLPFETDLAKARENLSPYAQDFQQHILARGNAGLSNAQAQRIAEWVEHLDVYCAVKAVESFMYSKADLTLLEIASDYGWTVHYDHMAIRCGSQSHLDAERISELLRIKHGYMTPQLPGEAYYHFPEGWNAYPMYKILENGQVLRVFIDQSDGDRPDQIIQHWNRIYGYTAHHLGLRATRLEGGARVAVPLLEVMNAMGRAGIKVMTPTGWYTEGLLEQVFTQPERNTLIPEQLKSEIMSFGEHLVKTIENAKLLELVARRELPPTLAQQYFALYHLTYDPRQPLHSAPIYQYFLPAQAEHVIKTSQQIA